MRDRLCAVCGRPVDGLEDAREAGGQWFCTQGHFLSYEARPRRRSPRGREVGGVLVGLVLLGALVWVIHPLGKRRGIDAAVPAGFHVQIDRKSMTNSYSAIKVGQCLFNHGIPDGVQAATQDQRFASFPPGVVSDLDTAAFLISGPPFSDLNIYFFGTPILARQGARRLAALDIYDQGIPSTATNKAVRSSTRWQACRSRTCRKRTSSKRFSAMRL